MSVSNSRKAIFWNVKVIFKSRGWIRPWMSSVFDLLPITYIQRLK